MNKETFKAGIIGTGNIMARHMVTLNRIEGVEIVANASYDGRHAPIKDAQNNELNLDWGKTYTGPDGYKEMLEQEDLDGVWVGVPPNAHGPIEEELIKHEKPFFVEKPLSIDPKVARDISSQLESKSLATAVGYQFRALEINTYVQEELQGAEINQVIGRWLDKTLAYAPPWWGIKEKSGGAIIEQMTHVIDWSRMHVGEMTVQSVEASYRLPQEILTERSDMKDTNIATETVANVAFEGGIPGRFESSAIYTGDRTVELEFVLADDVRIILRRNSLIKKKGDQILKEITVDSDFVFDPTEIGDRAFIDAVQKNDPKLVVCDYASALKTHEVCVAITEKAQTVKEPLLPSA